ncbi:MAG: perilipin family protein [Oscillospiraceae bacterium]|jgi:hypothetical protein|nr:perilipin family protein [Oscillospiraceae bacterium]
MAQTLDQLAARLKAPAYTPPTEEELLRQARAQYEASYAQERLGAQQAYEDTDLAYQQQQARLADNYAREARQAKAQTAITLSETERQALSRGMQRSSYNAATLGNLRLSGDQALGDIARAQTQADSDIAERRALEAKQLAEQLRTAQYAYEQNVQAYSSTLRQQAYDRAQEAQRYQNELQMALYEYNAAQQQAQQKYDQWAAEFQEELRRYNEKTSGSSGSKRSTKSSVTSTPQAVQAPAKTTTPLTSTVPIAKSSPRLTSNQVYRAVLE